MWTERLKTISNFHEAMSYIESKDDFHDYRLGNIEVHKNKNRNTITIMVEEDTGNKHNQNAHIWSFSFNNTSEEQFEMDCVIPAYISEIEIEDHLITFNLNNGYISFKADEILLGIPKP